MTRMHRRSRNWLLSPSKLTMKMRLWGINARLLTFSLLSICFGCGAPSPQTVAPKQSQGSENAADVTQAFSGFDSAVEEQVASISTNPNSAAQATSKCREQSKSIAMDASASCLAPSASAPHHAGASSGRAADDGTRMGSDASRSQSASF